MDRAPPPLPWNAYPPMKRSNLASGSSATNRGSLAELWDGHAEPHHHHHHHRHLEMTLRGDPFGSTCWVEEQLDGLGVVRIEQRVPSVEEILEHVRNMRQSDGSTVVSTTVSQSGDMLRNGKRYGGTQQVEQPQPVYQNVEPLYDTVAPDEEPLYDVPKNLRMVDVVPTATQLVLQATVRKVDEDELSDCDQDSLEDNNRTAPDIPSPDYGSDEDDAAYGVYEDYPSEFSDSGIGESDGRSTYYLDDQGLEVIIEEEEEDYISEPCEEEERSELSSLEQCEEDEDDEDDASTVEVSDDTTSQKIGKVVENDLKERKDLTSSCPDLLSSVVDSYIPPSVEETSDTSKISDNNNSLMASDETYLDNARVTPPVGFEDIERARPAVVLDEVDNVDYSSVPDKVVKSNNAENATQWTFAEIKLQNGHQQNGGFEEESPVNGANLSVPPVNGSTDGENNQESYKSTLPSVRLLRSCFESKGSAPVAGNFSTLPTRTKKRSNHRNGLSNGDCQSQPEKTQTLPIRRSRSVASQDDKSIPELIRSLGSEKMSNTLPKQSHKTRSYINTQNQTVRTAKPIFSPEQPVSPEDVIPSIIAQFTTAAHPETSSRSVSLQKWDPTTLLNELYQMQSPLPTYSANASTTFINIEGYLDKLPSGRKKATFWNAWKRRYFKLKDGYLYYYQNQHAEKPSLTLNLMGGHIDSMDTTMLGIDDGKGHYVVIRCCNRQEMEQWKVALQTHAAENFNLTYIQPVPAYPHFYEDVIVLDLGSSSTRAGILCNQPTLPQLFFPSVYCMDRASGDFLYGVEALASNSTPIFPFKATTKIVKNFVDMQAIAAMFSKIFADLNVDSSEFQVQLCLPSSFTVRAQTDILRILFEQFEVKAVNLTPQTVLSLLSYNATSGIIVDIGERLDVIPIIDGYVVEPGVARIPYGGGRIVDHLRHFLLQRNYSLVSDTDAFLVRYVLEQLCYCPEKYNEEMQRFNSDPESFERSVDLKPFFTEPPWDSITLDTGAFQATEGLFNPDAWGLDNPGVHKLVHKAIQECSLDIRKEMTRSIYLSGGLTLLPGFASRLELEVDKLTPPSLIPKVHGSPYRYHAAYLGACVLAGSPGFQEAKITRDDWTESGAGCLRKWHL